MPKVGGSPGCFLLRDAILLLVIRHTSAEPVCKKSTRGEVLPLLLCYTGRCPEDQRKRKAAVACKRDSGHGNGIQRCWSTRSISQNALVVIEAKDGAR